MDRLNEVDLIISRCVGDCKDCRYHKKYKSSPYIRCVWAKRVGGAPFLWYDREEFRRRLALWKLGLWKVKVMEKRTRR